MSQISHKHLLHVYGVSVHGVKSKFMYSKCSVNNVQVWGQGETEIKVHLVNFHQSESSNQHEMHDSFNSCAFLIVHEKLHELFHTLSHA